MNESSLEGWAPGGDVRLSDVIDRAFDYRGNVTVHRQDGSVIVGYLFNRNAQVAAPYIQMFDADGSGPFSILYAEIQAISFTGKDPAAGNSYTAWLERKAAAKAEGKPAPQR
jgi:hypothetical protein